jgi:hypothetical protein
VTASLGHQLNLPQTCFVNFVDQSVIREFGETAMNLAEISIFGHFTSATDVSRDSWSVTVISHDQSQATL